MFSTELMNLDTKMHNIQGHVVDGRSAPAATTGSTDIGSVAGSATGSGSGCATGSA